MRRLATHFRLGVASSSNRPLIDEALRAAGLEGLFAATVSSEEVARGKPAPDVYLEATRRLGVPPEHKKHALFDGGHAPGQFPQVIREILDWFDRYLGPVTPLRRT